MLDVDLRHVGSSAKVAYYVDGIVEMRIRHGKLFSVDAFVDFLPSRRRQVENEPVRPVCFFDCSYG